MRRAMWERRELVARLQRRAQAAQWPFTYRAKRPMHPERFFECLSRGQAGLCSLEGVAWLASRYDEHAIVQHPPSAISSITRGPPFWASLPRSEWPDGLVDQLLGTSLWSEPFGDRQVEIKVSVAAGTVPPGRASVEAELQACLLTDGELQAGREAWKKLRDPFREEEEGVPFSFEGAVGDWQSVRLRRRLQQNCWPCGVCEEEQA